MDDGLQYRNYWFLQYATVPSGMWESRTALATGLATLSAEASGFLVGPTVFKTDVGVRAPRRVRFPSASATSDLENRDSVGLEALR